MEIRNNLQLAPLRAVSSEGSQTSPVRAGGSTPGELQVSDSARELGQLAKLVHAASGIRQDKVDAIRSQIESGSYHVNLDKLADRMSSEV
ncbi:flagellar biosynthesis anti-sigma factor FlgM [bacterium]|nr:flagellar biosynthesis anti-sigma factor FlgM [bacterium]